jgi:MSHA biogenesis protein MshP
MTTSRGFAMVAAIFLLVILSLLGAYMVSFSTTQNAASAQDVQGSRAFRAAQLGLEWAATALCNGAGCATPLTACPAASTTLDTSPDGFSVTVACAMSAHQETSDTGSKTRRIFQVTATAQSGGSVGSLAYVERSLGAQFEFPD